jgi:hypothetical protein
MSGPTVALRRAARFAARLAVLSGAAALLAACSCCL